MRALRVVIDTAAATGVGIRSCDPKLARRPSRLPDLTPCATSTSALSRGAFRRGQSGAFLLEALVGVLIFAFGILGLVGLQAVALRNTNDLQYRGEAIQIANAYIGRMWTMDRRDLKATLRRHAGTGGDGYDALVEAAERLPSVTGDDALAPTVVIGPARRPATCWPPSPSAGSFPATRPRTSTSARSWWDSTDMAALRALARSAAKQRGISLIELMVGVVIGLIAILVIYQTFAVAEGVKRQTISAGDAQKTGMIAMYLLGTEVGNAGSGIMLNQDDFATCNTDAADITKSLRPFSIIVTPGADDDTPDSFVVNYGTSRSVVTPSVYMAKTDPLGTTSTVQSPTGFKTGDMAVAISGTGNCERLSITGVTAPDANGNVVLTHNATKFQYLPTARLVNIGPDPGVVAQGGGISESSTTSRTACCAGTTCQPEQRAQPLSSSIMNLKLQYGIDTDGDGAVDAWTAATGDYAPDKVLADTGADLRRIKAGAHRASWCEATSTTATPDLHLDAVRVHDAGDAGLHLPRPDDRHVAGQLPVPRVRDDRAAPQPDVEPMTMRRHATPAPLAVRNPAWCCSSR